MNRTVGDNRAELSVKNSARHMGIIALFAGMIFVADLFRPIGFAPWVVYIMLVPLSLWSPWPRLPLACAATFTILIYTVFLCTLSVVPPLAGFLARSTGVGALWVVAGLCVTRKRVENLRSESEAKFRVLVENTGDVIARFDRQHRYLYINGAASQYVPLGPEAFIGKTHAELGFPEERARAWDATIEQVFSTGKSQELEIELDGVQGRRVFAWRVFPELDEAGRVKTVVTVSRDITERKRTEDALRESEERYRLLFEGHPQPMYLHDVETLRFLAVNEAAIGHYGYSRDEFLAMTIKDHRPPEEVFALSAFLQSWDRKTGRAGVWRHRKKDGTIIEAHISAYDFALGGRRVRLVLAADVTEQRRAEEALRYSEASLRTLVENAPLGIFRSRADGTLVAVNPALVRMLGYESAEELLTRNLEADVYKDPAVRTQTLERRRSGFLGTVEAEWKRKDGTLIVVRTQARVLSRDAGAAETFETFVEDVTEQRQTEQQLRQAQKLEAIGQLAGGVAHDFNNLLGVILGRSHVLLKEVGPASPLYRQIETIVAAGDRAAGVTRQLLAFSRRQALQPKVLDLGDVVAGVERLLHRLIREDIELVTVRGADLGPVRADQTQMEQILMNLVVNARDAMPRGGRLTITVANAELHEAGLASHPGARPGRYVRLTVQDTGIGMDAATRARLFEPFFTTKGPGAGTGLGLATVYGIVEQSGGFITVDSAPGEGVRFDIFLPRVDAVVEERAPAPGSAAPRGAETILLVEDEEGLRELAKEVLEEQGYTVLEARDAREAVRLSEHHAGPIHLVLSDVVMPQMSGPEVAEQITGRHPETRVLFMSGYMDDVMTRHSLGAGGRALLPKPFEPEGLARKVREVLDA